MKISKKNFIQKIIKKYKCELSTPSGYWHSIDNLKDLSLLNVKNNSKKYSGINKILKKLK